MSCKIAVTFIDRPYPTYLCSIMLFLDGIHVRFAALVVFTECIQLGKFLERYADTQLVFDIFFFQSLKRYTV